MFNRRTLSVGLLSASSLVMEIALTHLLSSIYYPPYVFAVISLSILGIGLGAALAAWQPRLRSHGLLSTYAFAAAVSACILVLLITLGARYAIQPLLYIALAIPYTFIGLFLATLFAQPQVNTGRLYMSDLVGAGTGAILAVACVNAFGATNSILIAVVGLAIVPFILDGWAISRIDAVIVLLIAGGLLTANLWRDWLKVDMEALHTAKPITEVLRNGGTIIETRYDAFARTDLVDPRDGSPFRLYVDGAATSIMPRAGLDPNLIRDIGFFPFATGQPERVFVLGPGGGLDVWFALQSGATHIDAVEANPNSNQLVREYGDYNGDLYEQPEVNIYTDEGRSLLLRTDDMYDLIFLSQVVTLVAERSGYALTENAVFTVEAFDDYLDHLTPNGQIAIKLYDEITLARAVSTAMAALNLRGSTDQEALTHLIAMLDPRADPPVPLLIVSNTPFSEDDALVFAAIARDVGFTPLLLPQILARPPFDAVAEGSLPYVSIVQNSANNIEAPTDNKPFFYQFERGIPSTLIPLLSIVAAIALMGVALLAVMIIRSSKKLETLAMDSYFVALGIGFITAEIVILQQTRLFLGHPVLSTTVTLATLLLAGGIGSGMSNWVGTRYSRLTRVTPVLVVGVLLLWTVLWQPLSAPFYSLPTIGRGLIAIIAIFPVGLLMGMPFPLGLRIASTRGSGAVALAWAINGIATVVGAAIAVTIAIVGGFNAVMIISATTYVLAAIAFLTLTGENIRS